MKLISWNVNGLRACEGKGFSDIFRQLDADFFCLQETKMQEGQLDLQFEGYQSYWNYAEKKGYSGTAIFTRHQPLSVEYGIGIDVHDHEGRVITLEMEQFYLVCCYTPNSQDGLKRLEYRMSLYTQLAGRTEASGVPHVVGRCLPQLPEAVGQEEARHPLWRPERSPRGNRPEEPEDQPHECGLHRRGAREVQRPTGMRIHRYLPHAVS